jgi:streptogramin lyase
MMPHGPLSGQTLGGKYLLGELLGRGGFGAVYQAENQLLHRPQAVKVLLEEHFSDTKFRERFLREARTLGALDHAQIVHVDDLGMERHLLYLVMPYISGGTLQDLLKARSGQLGLEEVMRVLEQMCVALSYAHAQGIVHLDLKPMNVLVHQDGRLLLSDFGLAHLLEQGAIEGGTSLHFGSPLYMAPEQFEGRPTRQSDIYALGVILYQLLAGRTPFEASSPAAIMRQHLMDPPPPLRTLRPDLPAAVEDVMARALAKQPEQRYTHAGDVLQYFQAALTAGSPVLSPAGETRTASTTSAAQLAGTYTGLATPTLPQTRRCSHCGADTPLPMRFCGACGLALETLPAAIPAGSPGGPGAAEAGVPPTLVGESRGQQGVPASQLGGGYVFPASGAAPPPGITPEAGTLPAQRKRADRLRSPLVLLLAGTLALILVGATLLVVLKPFSHTVSPPTVTPGIVTEFPVPTLKNDLVALTAGPDGNLWFAAFAANKIGRITPGGIITEFAGPPSARVLDGITAGPDGNLWFFLDGPYIGRITPGGVIMVLQLPAGVSSCISGITTGPDGNLWCGGLGNVIIRISPSGAATQFPLPAGAGALGTITSGPDGNLWFTEGSEDKGNPESGIGRITPGGSVTLFPLPHSPSDPAGITKGPDGNLWFTNPKSGLDASSTPDQIGRISPIGTITEAPLPQNSEPNGITAGPDGNLWFTESGTNKIGRITPSGVLTEFSIPTFESGPGSITVGPDGNLWFVESGANKIGRITPG